MKTLDLTYASHGQSISDFEIEVEYNRLKELLRTQDSTSVVYSTSVIFNRVILGVLQDDFNSVVVTFIFENK